MKEDTILLLGALGIGAFILYKPLQQTGEGIGTAVQGAGTAVQGLGQGISDAGRGVGAGIGQAGESLGQGINIVVEGATAPIEYYDSWWEQKQREAESKTETQLPGKEREWESESSGSADREERRQEFYTDAQDTVLDIPGKIVRGVGTWADWIATKLTPSEKQKIGTPNEAGAKAILSPVQYSPSIYGTDSKPYFNFMTQTWESKNVSTLPTTANYISGSDSTHKAKKSAWTPVALTAPAAVAPVSHAGVPSTSSYVSNANMNW